MIRRFLVFVSFSLLLLVPTVTLGGGLPRTHDGFFLRLSGGGGHASTSIGEGGSKLEMSGGAADINLAIGGVVSRDLILHGTLFGWAIADPTVKLGSAESSANADLTMSGFGGGITYYFMPVNMYLSPTVGLASLSLDGDVDGSTDLGFALDLTLGKEWWVGGGWGLGLAGMFGYHSIPEKGVDESWSGTSFAVRFSATMN